MYFREIHVADNEYKKYNIIALDVKTGLKKAEASIIDNHIPNYNELRVKKLNVTISVFVSYFENKISDLTGMFRFLLDENCNVIDKDYKTWQDISTAECTIKPNGKLKQSKKYFNTASFLMFNDGSMTVVNQEYNTRSFLAIIIGLFSFNILTFDLPYEIDVYFFNFDEEFNPNGITRIDMKKYFINQSYLNNYLFSQFHGNNSSAVVCFLNNTKIQGKTEKELVINTVKNNEVKTERIPLTSSRKYTILPNPAKDGYIMLNEYNKKDKYNEIRLEKLNN